MKTTTEEYLQRIKIEEILEKHGVVANVDYEIIAQDIAKIFLQPDVSRSLPADSEAKIILRELIEMYMFNVDKDGEPKASTVRIVELWQRASKIIEC